MGQKINGIALRLGGRTWWWSSNLKKYEWEFVNNIVTGVLKKEKILISELVIKKLTSDVSAGSPYVQNRTQWDSLNSLYNNQLSYGFSSIKKDSGTETLYISGLIFKPEISYEDKKIRLLKTVDNDWLKLKNLLACSRLQSSKTNKLLTEVLDGLLTEILKSELSGVKDVKYDFQFVTTPVSNSLMLGNWLELCLLPGGSFGQNTKKRSKDRRLLKMILSKDLRGSSDHSSKSKQKKNSWNKWVNKRW